MEKNNKNEIEVLKNNRKLLILPNGTFRLIEASMLSLEDEFMKYEIYLSDDYTRAQYNEYYFKTQLTEVIKKREVMDFYHPIMDPTDQESGRGVEFVAGRKAAIGWRTASYWAYEAENFYPERKSRLETREERIAFLGVLIKELVNSGWPVMEAWHAVCRNSKKIGHFLNSPNAKWDLEDTASREICGFYDLGNTYKLLAEDKFGNFWITGGYFGDHGCDYSLANMFSIKGSTILENGVGEIVLAA